ncbi:MAG: hypothetical protein IT536_09190 [Hyphomicrobiales bacterium]|nr:hypothetical protein [Hyphomicrobiales bacterium]
MNRTRLAFAVPIFCGLVSFATLTGAQQQPPSQPKADQELMVAPNAPRPNQEAAAPPSGLGSSGRPANICQELVAHVQKKAAEKSAKPPGKPASNDAGKQAPAPQAQSSGSGGGPATTPAKKEVDKAQQSAGYSAPVPAGGQGSAPVMIPLAEAQALATANNLRGCQNAVRKMRLDGVALPPSLLALGALREELLLKSEQPSQ